MYKIIGADGKEYGPASLLELQGWIRDRRANGDTLAQGPGMTDWKPLRDFPEFAQVLQETPQAMAAPAAVPPPPAINPADLVAGPAAGLMVVGALVLLGNLLGLFSNLLGLNTPLPTSTGDAQMDHIIQLMSGTLGTISALIGMGLGGVTLWAGARFRQLKNYNLVMAMLILNMIPCCNSCCCLIGLPIGIWGITVLKKPEVKSAFLQ
jgi:hypothetical protein